MHPNTRPPEDEPGTLIPLDVPVPPGLAEACGYHGQAKYVGLCWIPSGDEVVFDDGQRSRTGNPWAFLAYRRHPNVDSHLEPYNLGYSDLEAEHALVIDRENDLVSVAPIRSAMQFLRNQHPPAPELTAYEKEELQRQLEKLTQAGWPEVRVDPEVIRRSMEKRRQDIARIIGYLDHLPDV